MRLNSFTLRILCLSYRRSSARFKEELNCWGRSEGNCNKASLRSVFLTEQLSVKQRGELIHLKAWHETRTFWETVTSYLAYAGWAWHAPGKSGTVDNFWPEGWAWGPALLMMAAHTVLSLLQEKVCSYSRGSAAQAFLNVAPPEKKPMKLLWH